MKHIVMLCLLALVALSSCAARMVLTGTAPLEDNTGTCANPILSLSSTRPMMLHARWSGRAAGEDSVSVIAGTAFTFDRTGLPAGVYSVSVWFSDAGGVGCDTTITTQIGGPPWKPVLN